MDMQDATQELRNIGLPLAIARPNFYLRALVSGLFTAIVLCSLNYMCVIHESIKIPLFSIAIVGLLIFFNNKVDKFYIKWKDKKWKERIPMAIIGFSNKVVILAGEDVIEEIETDEIEIKRLSVYEKQDYFTYTSAIYAKLKGKIIKILYVDGITDYEGQILSANPDRVNEDIEIIYDDDEDNSNNGVGA